MLYIQKNEHFKTLFFIIFSAIFYLATNTAYCQKQDYLIMLSLDGFRWDYAGRVETPNLDFIATNGVKAEYIFPVFPSKTFPNHYSMATGLYPDSHGIVDNNFYCPELDAIYRLGDKKSTMNGDFYSGEPIWVTAEKQNITSASYYWVGSEAPVQGIQPTYWKEYDRRVPYSDRIDTVIAWLELPSDKRPQLITIYFNEPDKTGHNYGPDHFAIDSVVMYLDSLVGVFWNKLERFAPEYNINFIVTSDHGMSEVSTKRYVNMSKYVNRNQFEKTHGGNPLLNLQPKKNMQIPFIIYLKQLIILISGKEKKYPNDLIMGAIRVLWI